jgi:hypothetical protein
MKSRLWRSLALVLSALISLSGSVHAASGKEGASFEVLQPVSPEAVRADAEAWLKKAVKDPARRKQFAAIWKADKRPLLDRVADTVALEPAAGRLLEEARNPRSPAPRVVPAVLRDAKQPAFYRANLALVYAKALSNRRIYEEALATLKAVRVEDVADPAAYLFHRAVAEYALLQKDNARGSIGRLLDEVADAPERYKTVAALMLLDMLTWKDRDLDAVAREMANSGRRLQLARGGPATQKIQKDIIDRLDEIIKRLERDPRGPRTPGNPRPGEQPTRPKDESSPSGPSGPGDVIPVRFKRAGGRWADLPEAERRKLLDKMTRGLPEKHAQAIQEYFNRMSTARKK